MTSLEMMKLTKPALNRREHQNSQSALVAHYVPRPATRATLEVGMLACGPRL
jgi:hypothetical protein